MLKFQEIDSNEFSVFIRNLTENMNTNILHMIEDNNNNIKKDKTSKKNKKKNSKTKEEIIEQQNKLRYDKNIKDDKNKIESFNLEELNPYKNFKLLKTEEMREKYCIYLLKYHWDKKNKNMEMILGLYYQYNNTTNPEHMEIINNIKSKLDGYEFKDYILENLGHILPPLNFWNYKKKLDDWQLMAIDTIKKNKTIFIRAPTSSGKSFIGLSTVLYYKKILYVCPAEPVVYQVGSQFQKLNYKVHYLVEDLSTDSYNTKCNVFVGTPEYIEEYLYKIGTDFDYAVLDEIHTIDDKYENIIKLLNCNYLALSATVSNLNNIIDIFSKFNKNKKIELIEYDKRFINIQRWVWTDKLEKVHPLTCIEYNDLTDNFMNYNLPFTPNDLSNLWNNIQDIFDDEDIEDYIETLSPENFFDDNDLITLNNVHDYEKLLKQSLIKLSKTHKHETELLLDKYKRDYSLKKDDIIQCFKKCKQNDMFPMLVFISDDSNTIDLFNDINKNLEKLENINYPYYYDILEKKQEFYLNYKNRLDNLSSNIKLKKSTNSISDKTDIIDKFMSSELEKYTEYIINYYNSLINKIENSDKSDKIKYVQIKNLTKELNKFMNNPDLQYQDIFKKHPNYCFTSEPMEASKIREIRRKINKSLNITFPYEHAIFQMLKRGIGIYHKYMPKDYKWIIQNLLANKEISIVISDRELCLGIDLPIRTTCLIGTNNEPFSNKDYLQMSGRAGRRGHDNQGNIIFYNLDFYSIMKSTIPDIIGSDKNILSHYKSLNNINYKIKTDNVFYNFINDNRILIETDIDSNEDKLLWILRNYDKPQDIINYINNYKPIDSHNDSIDFLKIIESLLNESDIVHNYINNVYHPEYKTIINLIILIYNSLKSEHKCRELFKSIYTKLKFLYIKYNNNII